ncbi:MAG: Mut7-C RNAse domain-containing protein [Thermoplasmataceae archaeon]
MMKSSGNEKASGEGFLADAMLGKLCRWMRFLGYDVEYADSTMDDDDIIRKCNLSNLILITMDVDLSQRLERSILLRSFDIDDQLLTILDAHPIGREKEMSRCPTCNGVLNSKSGFIGNLVPEAISRNFHEFWVCTGCGRIYWKGSHYDRITKKLSELRDENNIGREK